MDTEVLIYCLLGVAFLLAMALILSNTKSVRKFLSKNKKIPITWNAISHLSLDSGKQVSLLDFNREITLNEAVIFLKENLNEVVLTQAEIKEAVTKLLIVKGSSLFALERHEINDVLVYCYNFSPFTGKFDSRLAEIDEFLCNGDDCYFLVPSVI
jgi:hypothetical protein